MRQAFIPGALLLIASAAAAQTSIAACGPLPDSTSRQVIKQFGGLRVCLVATRVADTEAVMPGEWAAKGATVVLETQRPDDNRRAVLEGSRVTWTINGRSAPVDSLAERWQKAVVDLVDARYEADALREQEAALRMDADSLPVRRERTKTRIADIEGLQMQLNNQILAERNRETLRRNDIARLERQRDDVQRLLSAEERKTATSDQRARAAAEANVRRYSSELNRLNDQIRRIESSGAGDGSRRIAAIEAELRALQAENSIALLRMQLANYDSTRVEDLEQQITQLGARQRLPALEARAEQARLALIAVLEARGKAPSR